MTTIELTDLELDDAEELLETGDELTITVRKEDGSTGTVQETQRYDARHIGPAMRIRQPDGSTVELYWPVAGGIGDTHSLALAEGYRLEVVSVTVEKTPDPRTVAEDLTPAIVRSNDGELVCDGGEATDRPLEEGAKLLETTEQTVYTVTDLTDDTVTMTYQYKHTGEPEPITETETHPRDELETALASDTGTFVVLERPSMGDVSIPLSEYEPETAADVITDINALLSLGDLSHAEAWAWYGVEVLGHSQTAWATRTGRDQSTVSKSLKRGAEKMEHMRIPLVGSDVVWDRKM